MVKEEQSNQLNLTVVALVALVAIVGLVALVMNAASLKNVPRIATGSQVVSAESTEENVAGQASSCYLGIYRSIYKQAMEAGNCNSSATCSELAMSWARELC